MWAAAFGGGDFQDNGRNVRSRLSIVARVRPEPDWRPARVRANVRAMTPDRLFFVLGSIVGGLAVVFGAFGAHRLQTILNAADLATFEVGVRYQMYHALALLAVAWACTRWPGATVTASGWLFVAGTVLFSGSLYALSLSGVRWLGAITPFGGLAFLAGWMCLGWAAWRG